MVLARYQGMNREMGRQRQTVTMRHPSQGHWYTGTVTTARKDRPCGVCGQTVPKGSQYADATTHQSSRTTPKTWCQDHWQTPASPA